jgi:hypothetical protein
VQNSPPVQNFGSTVCISARRVPPPPQPHPPPTPLPPRRPPTWRRRPKRRQTCEGVLVPFTVDAPSHEFDAIPADGHPRII